MIDDPATIARLMEQLQAHLPIPAHPTPELARLLRERGLRVRTERVLRRALSRADLAYKLGMSHARVTQALGLLRLTGRSGGWGGARRPAAGVGGERADTAFPAPAACRGG